MFSFSLHFLACVAGAAGPIPKDPNRVSTTQFESQVDFLAKLEKVSRSLNEYYK